jgi:hypothetical protein
MLSTRSFAGSAHPSPITHTPEGSMAMNTTRIITGGIVAGVVLNIIDFVNNSYLMGDRMRAEMEAVAPSVAERMMSSKLIILYLAMNFVLGILLVWLYAAMRPRFGPGLGTALYGALFVWILGGIFYSGYPLSGMMSGTSYAIASVVAVVNLGLASVAGAWLYRENGATT